MDGNDLSGLRVRLDNVIAARGYVGFELRTGEELRVVDLEGKQVADIVCFNLAKATERLSTNNSIAASGRWLLSTGDVLYSDEANPMLTIVHDSVGVNKASPGCCSDANNYLRYGKRGTANCLENLTLATAPLGLSVKDIPGAFCTFMKVIQHPDGRQEVYEPPSVPGDYIDLRAEMDMFVAISNCPQDLNPCNGFRPTSIRVVVFERVA